MILYFTGTGNSKFVADFLADKLNDKTLSLNSVLKNNQKLVCNSDNPFVITAPIYAWRLPHKIEELIKNAEFTGNKNVYFVVTMGENSGNADKYIEKILTEKGLNLAGYIGVSMQNNYLVMEKMPDITVVNQHIENIFPKLEYIADSIRNNKILKKVG